MALNKKARYSFDTLTDLLGNDDLVDYKTVKRDFMSNVASSDLDMNAH